MNVIGQIFRRIEQPQKSLADHARGGFTRPIPWGNLLVPRTLVQGSDRRLDLWIADYQELPALHVSAARRTHTSLQDLSDQLVRHRVWFQPPHRPSGSDDLEQVASLRPAHGIDDEIVGANLFIKSRT